MADGIGGAAQVRSAAARPLPAPAAGPVWLLAAGLAAALVGLSGRYGPHRDELYFVAAGRHLAWGYPDQPALTPLLARLADTVAPGSLTVLRLPSALAAAGVVLLTGATARELGGGRAAQVLAALVMGLSSYGLVVGHLLSTSSVDLLVWTAVSLLALRALLRDEPAYWLAVGLVAGVGLENKHLVALLLLGLAAGIVLTPAVRHHLRSPWALAGAGVALALWTPNLLWQAADGWPQLALAADVRQEYGTAGERLAQVVFAFLLVSPPATALWGWGLYRLATERTWRGARPFAVAYVLVYAVVLGTGGKGYYLGGLYPVLVAAGAVALERTRPRWLPAAGVGLALSALPGIIIALPVLPVRTFVASPFAALAEDPLETVGWPAYAAQLRAAVRQAPPGAVVLTQNYGEAGAAQWYGVGAPVFSGHNGWAAWGPPPEATSAVVVSGYDDPTGHFQGCRAAGRVDNAVGAANEEQGGTVWICAGPLGGWHAAWPGLVHLDA